MSTKLRWGIIGGAGIAVNAVMPAIRHSETSEIVAIASRNWDKAKAIAESHEVGNIYSKYEELLADPLVDAVYIPLPNHLHREWAIRAAEAGKHVLCEKPLALSAKEAQEMVNACKDAGVQLAEAFMYRHHSRWERIREIIDSGEIGKVRALRGAFTFNNAGDKNNIRYREDWGGGSLYDVGCYPLSAARFVLGTEPEAVTVLAQFSPEHDNVDMMASGLVEFPGDVALTFDCGMWASFRQTFDILGADGRIEISHAFMTSEGNASYTVYSQGGSRLEPATGTNAYVTQIDNFARAVWNEHPQYFSPDDAIRNMKVLDACYLSAKEKARIKLA